MVLALILQINYEFCANFIYCWSTDTARYCSKYYCSQTTRHYLCLLGVTLNTDTRHNKVYHQ